MTAVSLQRSLAAWGTPQFDDVFKRELEAVPVDVLPLQLGLSRGTSVLDEPRNVMIIAVTDTAQSIHARVGVFYSGILAGCSCADDPTPVEAQPEYVELALDIDKTTGEAHVRIGDANDT